MGPSAGTGGLPHPHLHWPPASQYIACKTACALPPPHNPTLMFMYMYFYVYVWPKHMYDVFLFALRPLEFRICFVHEYYLASLAANTASPPDTSLGNLLAEWPPVLDRSLARASQAMGVAEKYNGSVAEVVAACTHAVKRRVSARQGWPATLPLVLCVLSTARECLNVFSSLRGGKGKHRKCNQVPRRRKRAPSTQRTALREMSPDAPCFMQFSHQRR